MNVLNDLDTIHKRIAAIQCQLAQLGPMRPVSGGVKLDENRRFEIPGGFLVPNAKNRQL